MFVQLVKRTSFIESEENEGEQKEEEMFDSSFLAEMYEVTFLVSFLYYLVLIYVGYLE